MLDTRPTYQIASPSIRPYVQPLWPGALAMQFGTRDEEGRRIGLADDHLSGRFLLLAFLSDPNSEQAIPLLRSLADLEPRLDAANATVIAISAASDAAHNKELKRAAGFPWPMACVPGVAFSRHTACTREVIRPPGWFWSRHTGRSAHGSTWSRTQAQR